MTDLDVVKIGQRVELSDGRAAFVQFVGQTTFAPGDWVGIELEEASGKNDGSVQGQRYFDCEPNHGMFLRPTAIASILEDLTPKPPKPSTIVKKDTIAAASKSRLGGALSRTDANGARRQSARDPSAAKRESMNAASPSPAPRRQTTINGLRPASRTVASTATSSATSSRGATPAATARKLPDQALTKPRQSLSANSSRATTKPPLPTTSAAPGGTRSRMSLLGPSTGRAKTMAPPSSTSRVQIGAKTKASEPEASSRQSEAEGSHQLDSEDNSRKSLLSRNASESGSDFDDTPSEVSHVRMEQSQNGDGQEDDHALASKQESVEARSSPSAKQAPERTQQSRQAPRTTVTGRQVEELEAKLKVLERKRAEDQEKLSKLDRLQGEKDKFEKVIYSLQAKYAPQAKELSSLRVKLKEAESKAEEVEAIKAEHESELEMATLDREMAEETAEALRAELEALQQRSEELQLEADVLREENEELGKEMSPEERTSQGWLQMERTNERMREALLRLRDVSQEQEAELKEQVEALEHDLKRLANIENQYKEAQERLARSEAAVEDLKQQLEAALNAEDMIEELAETNNVLNEEMSKLRTEVDELQTINELNDEFEQQHLENERQMQEEIDVRGASLQEHVARAVQQDERLNDYEYTITKFRDLVGNLQSDLEDMKASQQLSEAEADELHNRSKAMTDLNLRLQSSAARTQINTIDLEIRRMEAQEALEHLSIIQMFLPDGFKSERNSVLAYLRFQRVGFKARLLHNLLRESSSNIKRASFEKVFTYCSITEQLAWVWTMCERFSRDIERSSVGRFAKYEGSLQDLDPVERALNGYIDAWKREDFRERFVEEELQRSKSLLEHLSEVHFVTDLATYADAAVARAALMQSNLETATAALSAAKAIVRDSGTAQDGTHDGQENILAVFVDQIDTAIAQSRSAKVIAGKTLISLGDMRDRSMTFSQDTSGAFSEAMELTATLSMQARTLGDTLLSTSDSDFEDGEDTDTIRTALHTFHVSNYPNLSNPPSPLTGLMMHIRKTLETLASLRKMTGDLSQVEEFEASPAPWISRAETLKTASQSNVATESELTRLKGIMQDRLEQLRIRDETLEEQKVKIELLESRTKDAGKRTQLLEELQRKLVSGKNREEELIRAMDSIESEVAGLTGERDHLRRLVNEKKMIDGDNPEGQSRRRSGDTLVSSSHEVESLKLEVRSLQGAVRYLRTTKAAPQQELGLDANEDLAWLSEPLFGKSTEQRVSQPDRHVLEREGANLFTSLIALSTNAQFVDLTRLPKNKLAWRPAKQKSNWLVASQQEQWEAWIGRSDRLLSRARHVIGTDWQLSNRIEQPRMA